MNAIASFFLRAKHWQIFLLCFGVFFVGGTALMLSTAATRSQEDFGKVDLLFGAVTVQFMLCFLAWLWSMGSFLNSMAKPMLRLRAGFFHFALVYPALYIFVFIAAIPRAGSELFAVILPLHFLAMFCMFYILYFVSKHLVLVETGKSASFYDYAGPFFLLWFYPIGVWIIQPRINRLYAERKNAESFTGANEG